MYTIIKTIVKRKFNMPSNITTDSNEQIDEIIKTIDPDMFQCPICKYRVNKKDTSYMFIGEKVTKTITICNLCSEEQKRF